MNVDRHREVRELLGAYVLGQLGDRDRAPVEEHLADCAACRAELSELRPIAAALSGLDPTLTAQADPPVDLGDRVVQRIQTRRQAAIRRTRIRRGAGALLVAASIAVAFGIGTWWSGPRNDPPVVAVALRQVAPGVEADAGLVKHTWGTELKLEATGLVDGASYSVTFVRDDGRRVSAGSFTGTGSSAVRCSVNAALPIDDAAGLTITDAAGAVVIEAEV